MYSEIHKIKLSKIPGLALDIDETLSYTLGYWIGEMQTLFGNPENLTVEEMIKKYRYAEKVPYWQTEEAFSWMLDQIESNELQTQLPLIEDAKEIVHEVDKIIPITAYITLRPTSVLEGTKVWLKKHNFPDAPVITRPDYIKHENGTAWKAHLLEYLYPQVMGIIDDNPSLVENLSSDYEGTVFMYDTSEKTRDDLDLYACANWKAVIDSVFIRFSK